MKLGIIADTHENMPNIAKAIDTFNEEEVDLVLHAGDIISPITSREFAKLRSKMVAVFGNNDGDKLFLTEKFKDIAELYIPPYETVLEGKKIILMHQPLAIDALLAAKRHNVIIYGHTHQLDIREGDPMVINPGECGGWLTGKSTFAILDLENMKLDVKHIN